MKLFQASDAPPLIDHWQSALLLIRLVTGELMTGYYVQGAFDDERGTWLKHGFDAYVINRDLIKWWIEADTAAVYLEAP